jgi:hypothetical protein
MILKIGEFAAKAGPRSTTARSGRWCSRNTADKAQAMRCDRDVFEQGDRLHLRHAVRDLRRSPGFTPTAILILAFAMSANTAIFSVIEGVLLWPLPYHDPQRLCVLGKTIPARNIEWHWTSYPAIRNWRDQRLRRRLRRIAAGGLAGNARGRSRPSEDSGFQGIRRLRGDRRGAAAPRRK